MTFATAQRHINCPGTAGLLCEITGQARNRVYRADEILAAIEEPLELSYVV